MRHPLPAAVMTLALAFAIAGAALAAEPPQVGDVVPDFTLKTLDGKDVKLSDVAAAGPVVLIVLRGYPGYQ